MFAKNSVVAFMAQFFSCSEMALKAVLVFQVDPLHVLFFKG